MGTVAATPNTRIWLDSYDLSGQLNAAELGVEPEVIDARAFSTSGPRAVVGNYGHRARVTALFDGDSSRVDAVLSGLTSTDDPHYLGFAWGANAVGSPAYEVITKLANRPTRGQTGQLITIQAEFAGAGPVSRGNVLANATATATGPAAAVQQTSLSTAELFQAVVRVLGGTFTSVTVQIQHSSTSGGPWTDLTGASAVLTGQGVARVTSSGGSEAWKRADLRGLGAGESVRLVVTGGKVTS